MDQATVQKLSRAIEARVRAELAWHDERPKPKQKTFDKLKRARRAVQLILEREFDPASHEAQAAALRRAYVGKPADATEYGAVPE